MARLRVSPWAFDSVPKSEREKIEAGLQLIGLLGEDDNLAADAADEDAGTVWVSISESCRRACNAKADAFVVWCMENTEGSATALCIIAAEVARQECSKRC